MLLHAYQMHVDENRTAQNSAQTVSCCHAVATTTIAPSPHFNRPVTIYNTRGKYFLVVVSHLNASLTPASEIARRNRIFRDKMEIHIKMRSTRIRLYTGCGQN